MQTLKNIGLVSWVLWVTMTLAGFGPARNSACHGPVAAACTCCCPIAPASGAATKTTDPATASSCSVSTCSSASHTKTVALAETAASPANDLEGTDPAVVRLYQRWLRHYLVDKHEASNYQSHAYASARFHRGIFLRLRVLLI